MERCTHILDVISSCCRRREACAYFWRCDKGTAIAMIVWLVWVQVRCVVTRSAVSGACRERFSAPRSPRPYHGFRLCAPLVDPLSAVGLPSAGRASATSPAAAPAAASLGKHERPQRVRRNTSNHSNNQQLRPDHRAALE